MIDFLTVVRQCAPNISPVTIQKLIRAESSQQFHAIGHKIIGKDGTVYYLSRQPYNVNEAISWAKWFITKGYKFDAGGMQINSVNFSAYGLTAKNVFDPCTNIQAGGQILMTCFRRARGFYQSEQTALHAALSCYNSGNFSTGFSNGYVQRVLFTGSNGSSIKKIRVNKKDARSDTGTPMSAPTKAYVRRF